MQVALLPAQDTLLRAVARLVAFVAGYGAGKTHSACLKALQLAAENPGCDGMFLEPTYKMCKNIAGPMLRRTCDQLGVVYKWREADMQLWVWVGAEPQWTCIHLLSAEKPDGIDGHTLAWAILDEAGQCKEEVPKKLLGRLRHPAAKRIQLILCGTPEGGPGTWFGQWAEFGPPTLKAGQLIRAATADNPFLPPSYLAHMEATYTPDEFKGYCGGYFVAAGGQVYRWAPARNLRPFHPDDEGTGRIEVWADFNVTKVVWLLAHVTASRARVFDEVASVNTYTDEQAVKVRERLAKWGIHPDVDLIHDANVAKKGSTTATRKDKPSKSDKIEVKKAGFTPRSRHQNPPVRDRVASVNAMLKAGTLTVDPRCKELIKSLATQGRDGNGQPDKAGGLDHAVDALGYGIHMHWPTKFKPADDSRPSHYY